MAAEADSTSRIGHDEVGVEPLGYRPALDGLRGVAIALVVWLHSMAALLVPQRNWHLLGAGLGVDIFFVLSGFLITTLLVERADEGPGRLRRFYARRAARLLPALFAFLLVHVAVALILDWNLRREVVTLVGALTFTSNWMPTIGADVAVATLPLWSLAVEEQFYLVWPAVLVVLARLHPGRARALVASAIVLVAGWRAVLTVAYGVGYPVVYQRTDARLDSILVGAALALLIRSGWAPSRRAVNAVGVAGALVVSFWVVSPAPADDALYFGGFTTVALGTAAVILALVRGGETMARRVLSWRPLVALGRISYSLYLWHYLVFVLVNLVLPDSSSPVRVAVAYAAVLACATASYRGIEQPVLRWAASAPPSRPRVAVAMPHPTPRSLRRATALAGATCAVLVGSGVALASAAREVPVGDVRGDVALDAPAPAAPSGDLPQGDEGRGGRRPPDRPAGSPEASLPSDGGSRAPTGPTTTESTVVEVQLLATRLVVSAPDPSDDVAGEPGEVVVTATLTTDAGAPLVGRTIHFVVMDVVACQGVTDDHGVATCVAVAPAALGAELSVVASFAGDGATSPSTGSWPGARA